MSSVLTMTETQEHTSISRNEAVEKGKSMTLDSDEPCQLITQSSDKNAAVEGDLTVMGQALNNSETPSCVDNSTHLSQPVTPNAQSTVPNDNGTEPFMEERRMPVLLENYLSSSRNDYSFEQKIHIAIQLAEALLYLRNGTMVKRLT